MAMMAVKKVTCRSCKVEHTILVPIGGYALWASRQAKIQDALPGLTDDERELLVSGICGQCFDKMFTE